MTVASPPGPSRLPLLALGLMSLATFAGPFGILWVLRGGARPEWPPDRPVEWVAFVAVCATVAVLMVACVTSGLWAKSKGHGGGG